jgi:cobalt-zinc-cadmium efflux system membrane fusion protein
MRRNRLQQRHAFICISAVILLFACRDSEPPEESMADMPGMSANDSTPSNSVLMTAAQIQHGAIAWEAVTLGSAAQTAVVPGSVVPDEDRTARLDAPLRGRVIAVRVRPGDAVRRGQDLVILHSPEAGTARSDVEKAQADVTSRKAQATYAKSARDRAERLLALKAIPRQDYERAVADDELARAEVAQAEAELRRALSTAEQLGATTSGEVALRTPLAGVVLSRTAMPGTVVEAGTPLIAITDPAHLWLTVSAPEPFASLLRVGGTLAFNVPAYPNARFTARVEAVGAGLDPDTRTLPVRAAVSNRDGRLKPQMLANVMIEAAQGAPAVMLPADAVQSMKGKNVVFLARPDDKGGARFTAREVDVGERVAGQITVLRGLDAGEVIVTRGAFAVKAQIEKASMPEMRM